MKKIKALRRLQFAASVTYLSAIVIALFVLNLSYNNWQKLDPDLLLFAFGFLGLGLMYFPFWASAVSALQLHITHVRYGELYSTPMKVFKCIALSFIVLCLLSGVVAIFYDPALLPSTATTVAAVLLTAADTLVCIRKSRILPKD